MQWRRSDYFRLVLAAAARRVFTRAFKRLTFFLCFRRIFRSFSRPRGIHPSDLKFSINKPRFYNTPAFLHTSNGAPRLFKKHLCSLYPKVFEDYYRRILRGTLRMLTSREQSIGKARRGREGW